MKNHIAHLSLLEFHSTALLGININLTIRVKCVKSWRSFHQSCV